MITICVCVCVGVMGDGRGFQRVHAKKLIRLSDRDSSMKVIQ